LGCGVLEGFGLDSDWQVKVGKPQDYFDILYSGSLWSVCPKEAYMELEPYDSAQIPPEKTCIKIEMVRIIFSTFFEFQN
jgi:hypothetical protein